MCVSRASLYLRKGVKVIGMLSRGFLGDALGTLHVFPREIRCEQWWDEFTDWCKSRARKGFAKAETEECC